MAPPFINRAGGELKHTVKTRPVCAVADVKPPHEFYKTLSQRIFMQRNVGQIQEQAEQRRPELDHKEEEKVVYRSGHSYNHKSRV